MIFPYPMRSLTASHRFKLFRAGLLALTTALVVSAAESRPNFVVILTDDQPYNGLGVTGNRVLKTPAMDQLARDGVQFDNGFVTTAICNASRASLLTGQHMRRHGNVDFSITLTDKQLMETFPVQLRQAGYRTAFLGKFGVGSPKENEKLALPAHLFDLWYGFPQNIAFKQVVDGKERYLTTVMEEKATQFFREQRGSDRPFCMVFALKEPHGPLDYFDPEFPRPYDAAVFPRPASLNRKSFEALPKVVREGLNGEPGWLDDDKAYQEFMRKRYAYIGRADLAVQRVRAALAANGLAENTVIVFLSDNGTMDGAHSLSGKWIMYEESIHVPFVVYDPRLPASLRGGRRQALALNIDVGPTLLAMAGVPAPVGMQGRNLAPLLRDPQAKVHDDFYYEHVYFDPNRPLIPQVDGVRTERWKYTRYLGTSPLLEQLFDLQADRGEEHDLARDPAHREILDQLRARTDAYRANLK